MKASHIGPCVAAMRVPAGILPVIMAVACLSFSMAHPAAAADLDAICQQTGTDKRRLECDVRFVNPVDVTSVTATVIEEKRTLPSPGFERYPKTDDVSAFLFLFDLSDPARAGTVNANIADARRILATARPHDRFGIATLPGGSGPEPSIDLRAPIGLDLYNVERRLGDMKAKGLASPIYRSSIESIRVLSDYKASRHAILMFTDGRAEDMGYTPEDVIKEAQKAHVAVFAFGIAERGGDTPFLQPLMRMAEATGGRYFQADLGTRHFSNATLDSVLKYVDNGVHVTVDLAGVASDQNVELAFATNGAPGLLTYRAPVQGLATQSAAQPPATQAQGWFGWISAWVQSHWIESILIGIAILLLLVALVIFGVRAVRRRRPDTSHSAPSQEETFHFRSGETSAPQPVRAGGPALATLQPLLAGGSPYPVRAPRVTIGRAADCDIRLNDETVSAHHATLMRKRDGSFELTDMGSRNGVRVNGERVNRQRVSNGDAIQLGPAEFRFVLKNAE
jgi:hypothetical protein